MLNITTWALNSPCVIIWSHDIIFTYCVANEITSTMSDGLRVSSMQC